jgi:hypothetical protein
MLSVLASTFYQDGSGSGLFLEVNPDPVQNRTGSATMLTGQAQHFWFPNVADLEQFVQSWYS